MKVKSILRGLGVTVLTLAASFAASANTVSNGWFTEGEVVELTVQPQGNIYVHFNVDIPDLGFPGPKANTSVITALNNMLRNSGRCDSYSSGHNDILVLLMVFENPLTTSKA